MRFMVMVKATKDTEAGVMPDTQLLTEMGNYNEQLVKAGIMQGGDGLHPSSRIFGAFPSEQQNHIMFQLSNSLQAIVAQKLLPKADGKGQVLACEVCIATPAIGKFIRDGQAHLIYNEIQTGRKMQMQSMDAALADLYQQGEITYDAAVSAARDPNQIRSKLTSTSGRA